MQDTTNKTLYTPLDPALKQIRLIELAPGNYDDDLNIRVSIHGLEDEGLIFTALSYVWGYEKCSRKAIVNGCSVIINRNLDCALRCLRDDLIGRFLWVDALCIRQDDIEERNHQVQLMRNISLSAYEVMIWLSTGLPTDDHVIYHITQNSHPDTARETTTLLRALKRICQRPWFRTLNSLACASIRSCDDASMCWNSLQYIRRFRSFFQSSIAPSICSWYRMYAPGICYCLSLSLARSPIYPVTSVRHRLFLKCDFPGRSDPTCLRDVKPP